MNKNWLDDHQKDKAPVINEMFALNKNLTKWIQLEIINSEKKKARASTVAHFIKFGSVTPFYPFFSS